MEEIIKCSMCKGNRCGSDYGNNIQCDGFKPPKKCPYKNSFGTSVGFTKKNKISEAKE